MIAIIGGGISGLTAAYELKKAGKEFILLEQNNHLGGKIVTVKKNGYTLEYGPNTVLINNTEIKNLLKELGLWNQLIFPDETAINARFVLKNNKIEQFPNRLSKLLKSKLFRLKTIFTLLKELKKPVKQTPEEESVTQFITRRFDQEILNDFITPFVTGIYAGDPDKMSVEYCLPLLKEAEKKHGSVLRGMMKIMKQKKLFYEREGFPKQKIFSFKNGLQTLIQTLALKVADNTTLNAKVESINKTEDGYKITYQNDTVVTDLLVNHIIFSIPANALAKIAFGLSVPFAKALEKINYVPALTIHLGINTQQLNFQQKAFGILSREQEEVPFLGILFNSHFFPHTAPKNKTLMTVICGGHRNPELLNKTNQEIMIEIKQSLASLLQLSGELDFHHIVRWEKGIPQYEVGYRKIESEIEKFLNEHTAIQIAANFYKGISVSDCIKNGKLAALNLLE